MVILRVSPLWPQQNLQGKNLEGNCRYLNPSLVQFFLLPSRAPCQNAYQALLVPNIYMWCNSFCCILSCCGLLCCCGCKTDYCSGIQRQILDLEPWAGTLLWSSASLLQMHFSVFDLFNSHNWDCCCLRTSSANYSSTISSILMEATQ